MTTTDVLKNLTEYNVWANTRILKSLDRIEGELPDYAQLMFSHLLNAQAIWIARITGTKSPVTVLQVHSLEELHQLHAQTSPKLVELYANADAAELARTIDYTNTQGKAYSTKVQDILTHAINHATYHRGQVSRELRLAGHEPINSDYVTYVRIQYGQDLEL
ncbi:damage-inducible protein DinB [Rufibacter radiotolerans]|uniref:Damage-inducible protein DinB n=1 Tax=Rufibacter radiotolerans TaxID=1379910 RepID=A0A0H4VR15_9BACT|nr:DinB family protein [Rufibacter radiotolerans]AKQ47808.1 damage-inducible protein DinB [Rufibacter radiotolerans]